MQLTRFDRWLRETFVYETHVQTLRPVENLPPGIKTVDLPDSPGKRYKHLYISANSKATDDLLLILKQSGQMYTTQIVERKRWYTAIIAPKEKSVSWSLFSFAVIAICVFFVLLYVKSLVQDPKFQKNFMEALQLLKG